MFEFRNYFEENTLEKVRDACDFEYFYFDKGSTEIELAQYNMEIAKNMIK